MAAVETAFTNDAVKNNLTQSTSEDLPIDLSCHNRKSNNGKRAAAAPVKKQNFKHKLNAKIEENVSDYAIKNIPFRNECRKCFTSCKFNNSDTSGPSRVSTHLEERSSENLFENVGKIVCLNPASTKEDHIASAEKNKIQTIQFEKSQLLQMLDRELLQHHQHPSHLQHLFKTMNDDMLASLFAQLKFSSFKEVLNQLSFMQAQSANYEANSTLSNLLSSTHLSPRFGNRNSSAGHINAVNTRQLNRPTLINFPTGSAHCNQEVFGRMLERSPTNYPALERPDNHENRRSMVEHHCSGDLNPEIPKMSKLLQDLSKPLSTQTEKNVFSCPQTSTNNGKEFLRVLNLRERNTAASGNKSLQALSTFNQLPHTMSHFKLSQHNMVKQAHPKPINFKPCKMVCRICGRSYATEGSLTKHIKIHENPSCDNTFKCKICKKACSTLGSLRMHIRTHTLPCECHICGKAFSRTWLLQGHIRTHTGEKPYECPKCSRAFADRSNLRAHMQTHEAIKRYGCQGCDKTFSRISLLKRHQRHCITSTAIDTKPQTSEDTTKDFASP